MLPLTWQQSCVISNDNLVGGVEPNRALRHELVGDAAELSVLPGVVEAPCELLGDHPDRDRVLGLGEPCLDIRPNGNAQPDEEDHLSD